MKKSVCLILLYAMMSAAQASDIILGGWSYHPDRTKGYNEVHHNIGIVDGDWVLGYYYNSNEKHTVHIGKNSYFIDHRNFRLGMMYGMAFKPFALLKASYDIGDFGIDLHALPNTVYQLNFRHHYGSPTLSKIESIFDDKWAVGVGYGLTGHSFSIHRQVLSDMNIRLNWNLGNKPWKDSWHNNTAEVWQREEIVLETVTLSADYYLFDTNLGVYAGVAYNNSKYLTRYTAHLGKGYVRKFEVHGGDRLDGVAGFDKLAFNAGVRYGNPFKVDTGWSWYVDAGVTTATGISASVTPQLKVYNEDVQVKIDEWLRYEEDKYSKYNLIPRLEVGLTYRFK